MKISIQKNINAKNDVYEQEQTEKYNLWKRRYLKKENSENDNSGKETTEWNVSEK